MSKNTENMIRFESALSRIHRKARDASDESRRELWVTVATTAARECCAKSRAAQSILDESDARTQARLASIWYEKARGSDPASWPSTESDEAIFSTHCAVQSKTMDCETKALGAISHAGAALGWSDAFYSGMAAKLEALT